MRKGFLVITLGLLGSNCAPSIQKSYPPLLRELRLEGGKPELITIELASDGRELLDFAIDHMLVDRGEEHTSFIHGYGGGNWTTCALASWSSPYRWPEGYIPPIDGVEFVHVPWDYTLSSSREPTLGLDVLELVIDDDTAMLRFLVHSFGIREIGGCSVQYELAKRDGGWVIELAMFSDP